jgi:hypothetical protein
MLALLARACSLVAVFCQLLQLNWGSGVPPYFITIIATGNTATYKNLEQNTNNVSQTWLVNLAPSTVTFVSLP